MQARMWKCRRPPLQASGIHREVLRELHRAAKIDDGHHAVGPGVGVNEFSGCRTRARLVAQIHRGVVKEQHHVVALRFDGTCGIRAEGKRIDGLLLVVFVETKIVGLQIFDVVALLVRHDHVHAHLARFRFDGGSSRRLLLRCLRRGFLWRSALAASPAVASQESRM